VSNLEEQLGAEAQERMIAAKNNRKPFSPDSVLNPQDPGLDTDPDPCFAIKIKVVFLTFF
jgi:hypothetical protein